MEKIEKTTTHDKVKIVKGDAGPVDPLNEKSGVGGAYNSGVTSGDPEIKEKIEKQASLYTAQPPVQKQSDEESNNK